MTKPIRVVIPGEPVAKGRPRVVWNGGKPRAFPPTKTARWERGAAMLIRSAYRGAALEGPVRLEVLAVKARPQRLMAKKHGDGLLVRSTRPDLDNIVKAVMDALQMAQLILDDGQVAHLEAVSAYAERGGCPRVELIIEPILVTGIRSTAPTRDPVGMGS